MIAASACLLGIDCRWNGQCLREEKLLRRPDVIPICPEQLGGLTTPREPAQIIDGNGFSVLDGKAKVVDAAGKDVTAAYISGAGEVLKIVRKHKVSTIVLKEQSPSCAVNNIYSGNKLIAGMGVTGALLLREGFAVLSSEEIYKLDV